MSDLWQDMTYALRKLRGSPGFTLTAMLTLALGIGANTAIFSVVRGVVLEPLPFENADEVMRIRFRDQGAGDAGSALDLTDLRQRSQTFQGFSVIEGTTINLLAGGGDPQRYVGVGVSGNFFSLLGVTPTVGRTFVDADEVPGAPRVAVISDEVWRTRFNGDAGVIGRVVRINQETATIVGVLPAGMAYPLTAQVWIPRQFTASELTENRRGQRWLGIIGRVRPGITAEQASAEVTRIAGDVERQFPDYYNGRVMTAVPLKEWIVGDIRKPLFVVMGAVAFVLLIACANVANLLLVRASAREGELAVRTALGAGRGRLLRQLVTESVILAVLGGAAGLVLAYWAMGALLSLAPSTLPRVATASVDAVALGVTILVTLVTGVVFGVLPGLQASRSDLASALRAGARGTRTHPAANRMKRAIVVAEVALAVTLLTGAGLLIRSFDNLLSVDPGFQPENVLTFRVLLPDRGYPTDTAVRNFAGQIDERLGALPGVREVAVSNGLPLDGNDMTITFSIRGHAELPDDERPAAQIIVATPDFFSTLGIPISRGRSFTRDDRAGSPQVAIVNEEFVRRQFSNEDPVGRYVELGWSRDGVRRGGTIVGIARDVKQAGLDQELVPIVYLPMQQAPLANFSVAIRTATPPAAMTRAVRAEMRSLDGDLPIYAIRSMDELLASSISTPRFYTLLLGIFASVALVLSAIGLYGVIAYAVGQRTHELGVRVALGATGERIAGMVVTEGIVLVVAGLAIGLVTAAALSRILGSLLFDVGSSDPATFVGVAIVLIVVAAAASYLPARRAAQVDPLIAMRGD